MAVHRWAAPYLVLQGVGALVWWGGLLLRPELVRYFLPADMPRATLIGFLPSDLVFFVLGSFAAAWVLRRVKQDPLPSPPPATDVARGGDLQLAVLCLHAGGVWYAGIWTYLLVLNDPAVWLGAVLMTPPMVVSAVLVGWRLRG